MPRRVRALKFAQEIKTPAGRQVILVADQHLGFGESGRDFESWQPEFTLIDIRLGADGKGVGTLAPAAKVTFNARAHMFEVANYVSQPVRLSDVRSEKDWQSVLSSSESFGLRGGSAGSAPLIVRSDGVATKDRPIPH